MGRQMFFDLLYKTEIAFEVDAWDNVQSKAVNRLDSVAM